MRASNNSNEHVINKTYLAWLSDPTAKKLTLFETINLNLSHLTLIEYFEIITCR